MHVALADPVLLLREDHDAAALGRLVGERAELGGIGEALVADPRRGQERRRLPVAERDRARLVEQEDVDVAGGLHRATARRDDVRLDHAIHAGDADGGEKAADRRRDQADEQRDQHRDGHRRARAGGADAVDREGQQRHGGEQEDDRQRRQQDVEGDLVGRLLALGALDHRDHPVEERLAGVRGDANDEPVGEDARAARHRAAVAAALADDGRALAGDRALVDRRDALDDLAVARDDVARLDEDVIALAKLRGHHGLGRRVAARLGEALGVDVLARLAQRVGLRLAASLGHRLGEVREEDGEPEPERDGEDEPGRRLAGARERLNEERGRQDAADLHDEHDGITQLVARVELAEGVDDRAPHDGRVEERARLPTRAVLAALPRAGEDARAEVRRRGRLAREERGTRRNHPGAALANHLFNSHDRSLQTREVRFTSARGAARRRAPERGPG